MPISNQAVGPNGLSRETVHENADEAARRWPQATIAYPASQQVVVVRELLADSCVAAASLRRVLAASDQPQRRIGLLFHNDPELLVAFFAVLRCGAAAVPLPLTLTADVTERISATLTTAGITIVITTEAFAGLVGPAFEDFGVTLLTLEQIAVCCQPPSGEPVAPPCETDADADAVVQFTSGSTSAPKGVLLTHRNILAAIDAMEKGVDVTPGSETLGVWLPLFHDMGLFSTLTAIMTGTNIVMWPPTAFVKSPYRWLTEFCAHKVAICPLPNFAYDSLVREVPASAIPELDLSHWRVAINGAEPIDILSIEKFVTTFEPAGFRRQAMMPVYGLAEATLAVSFPPVDASPRTMCVDADCLRVDGHAIAVEPTSINARPVVCLGMPVKGIEIQIRSATASAELGPGQVGHIRIRGPAVTRGYLTAPDTIRGAADPDGWVDTGDLGFTDEQSNLYITGRAKEIIIIRGQNYYPEDVERAIRNQPEVYKGRCVAFGDESENEIAVIAETDVADLSAAKATLREAITTATGITALNVFLVRPRSIPRTTSGKLQRLKTKSMLEKQEFQGE